MSSADLTGDIAGSVQGVPTPTSVAPFVEGLTRPPALRTATGPPTEDKNKSTPVAPSSTVADSWQQVNIDKQDDKKERKEIDPSKDGESDYAFEDAVSLDPNIVHVTGDED